MIASFSTVGYVFTIKKRNISKCCYEMQLPCSLATSFKGSTDRLLMGGASGLGECGVTWGGGRLTFLPEEKREGGQLYTFHKWQGYIEICVIRNQKGGLYRGSQAMGSASAEF